ncbi:MAG: hypothetical protein HY562_00585, partial [Ignavibacteriales bacterium]|nr:hypothetical protein [Ignavibacteriales bacterium]
PYIAGNMGTGTPQEMADWIEYLNFGGESQLATLRRKNGQSTPFGVSFWGIGNESWGCGGNMTPEYYANLYKQYATFCQNFPGTPLKKIAVGPIGTDYNWTEVVMKNIPVNQMWGLSVHYYTVPTGNWQNKGSATQFDEAEYFGTMRQALRMEEIISTNEGIMNRYDPQKRVAIVMDEWGVWTNVEPGTNPQFLYQQNSLRDALVAATTLNIFNNHCERVKMANLAQTVNVLQALILTEGDKMLLTPTYHVFEVYKVHQDARWMPVRLASPDYVRGNAKIPSINASASEEPNGNINISLVNLHPRDSIRVSTSLPGIRESSIVGGKLLTSEKFTDINTFENPRKVVPKQFGGARKVGEDVVVDLPPQSVVLVTLRYPIEKATKVTGRIASAGNIQDLFNLLETAKQTGGFKTFVKALSGHLKEYGLNFIPGYLNDMAWEVFLASKDKADLQEALLWSKRTIEAEKSQPMFLDTYANLLHKLGRTDEAIVWQQRAIELASADQKQLFKDTLEKMKRGEKTW